MGDLDALARELVEAGCPWHPAMMVTIALDGRRERGRICARDCLGPSPFLWVSGRAGGPMLHDYPERDPAFDLTDWPTIGALLGELSGRGRPLLCQHPDGVWACDLIGHGVPRSARAVKADTPGEAVGRALLAVLRAERVKP